jgi:hypothetical protein
MAVALAGCLGATFEPSDTGPSSPYGMFVSQVYPVMTSNCSGCHYDPSLSIGYVPNNAFATYLNIVSSDLGGDFTLDGSKLGQGLEFHASVFTGEQAAQLDVFTKWLQAEHMERFGN